MSDPAYIDEHSVTVPAPREQVWEVARSYAVRLALPTHGVVGWAARVLWAAEPGSGFRIASERPGEEVALAGRHRFSRYRLVFELTDATAGGTVLTARSYGDFSGTARTCLPGARGRHTCPRARGAPHAAGCAGAGGRLATVAAAPVRSP